MKPGVTALRRFLFFFPAPRSLQLALPPAHTIAETREISRSPGPSPRSLQLNFMNKEFASVGSTGLLLCVGASAAVGVCWTLSAMSARQVNRGGNKRIDRYEEVVPARENGVESGQGSDVGQGPTVSEGCPGAFNGYERVVMLYESYIHLEGLREKWKMPITSKPVLEPSFVAAMHGVELGFLLLADFLQDSRAYIVMQHRIELVSKDVRIHRGFSATPYASPPRLQLPHSTQLFLSSLLTSSEHFTVRSPTSWASSPTLSTLSSHSSTRWRTAARSPSPRSLSSSAAPMHLKSV